MPLRLTATAEVYFQPTVANLNGTIANALTFRPGTSSTAARAAASSI